ncbi:hypothetical protein IV203_013607 [Nitzschia inconspicua]|uniref:Uncharacterized protein n=1 Tax=Nitzschia inconspicua TaxID=303405 RepID=A0A9K3M5U7_9STRA|nr:hypothetical protein IV203_013607 [Nitzschia inconspicua]
MATPSPTGADDVPPSAESADTFQSAVQQELEPTVTDEATPIQMRQLFPNPGHKFKEVMIPELVRFDGALIRDGLLGGATDGAIYLLKRVWKLNDNEQAKKRGEEGYDPTYKYDYIFKAMIHNVRVISERALLDLCGDETTWGHQGYGEKGSGVLERIRNKPGITKGMQTVLLCDAYRFRVYAYHHRHKMHKGWPEWSKKQGPTETDPGSKPAKCARFSRPVTAVKVYEIDATDANDNKQYYTRVHVSMQSTSSTNFSTVNAMNENKKWIAKKDRGRVQNKTKRVWGIEMNTARQLYLKTYGQIDTVDSMLRRCRIYNKSFKYWHSSKNHALAMAVVLAYDMYLECTTETPCHEFFQFDDTTRLKLSKGPLKFHDFKDKLSIQMLTYTPVNVFYPGDRNFREVTEMTIARRNARKRRATTTETMPTATIGMLNDEQFAMMMKKRKVVRSRFCGDLTKYKQHLASKETTNTRNNCFVCGDKTKTRCALTKRYIANRFCHCDSLAMANKSHVLDEIDLAVSDLKVQKWTATLPFNGCLCFPNEDVVMASFQDCHDLFSLTSTVHKGSILRFDPLTYQHLPGRHKLPCEVLRESGSSKYVTGEGHQGNDKPRRRQVHPKPEENIGHSPQEAIASQDKHQCTCFTNSREYVAAGNGCVRELHFLPLL